MLHSEDRLYLQYKPDEAALSQLLDWQRAALVINPQAREVQQNRMHLTVIHFGIITDVYRELREQQADLTWEAYTHAVEEFINRSQSVLPEEITVRPERFELFGSRSSVLALRVRVPDALLAAHKQALSLLKECIISCGIMPPEMFMQGSLNFRFALRLEPHLSLIKAARHRPNVALEAAPPLKLSLMPMHYQSS